MGTKFAHYRLALDPLPSTQWTWPLYGAGLQNLGRNGAMVRADVPVPGRGELLARIDAVSLCFSDLKIVQMGDQHPRLAGRDLARRPVLAGHEVAITVVAVGSELQARYAVGQRFSVQPAVWYGGRSIPFGYTLDGGFQQYCLIGREILQGDTGCYLLPIPDAMSYAGAALTEPWACVEAAYRNTYRDTLRAGGRAWFLGTPGSRSGYHFDAIWPAGQGPAEVVACQVPPDLALALRAHCRREGAKFTWLPRADVLVQSQRFDDILIMDASALTVDYASRLLADGGVLAIAASRPQAQPIQMDLGRVHYDQILYTGTSGLDLDAAYRRTPARAAFLPGGTLWVAGAGGAMGHMHVQRALESAEPPRRVLATEVSAGRARRLEADFARLAAQRRVELLISNPAADPQRHAAIMAALDASGAVDDVEMMVSDPGPVIEACRHLAVGGVINLFAGLKRGTPATLDAWQIYGTRQARIIGHSGSGLDDQLAIVRRAAARELVPERSMMAVAGLRRVPDGLHAMVQAVYPGKIVIYPHVTDFPLTALPDLDDRLPEIFAELDEDLCWNQAAEEAFLEVMLPELKPGSR
jgi:L-sorbose 1-phosphate reductase